MPRFTVSLGLAALLLAGTAAAAATSLGQSVETGVRDAQLKRGAGDFSGAVRLLSQLMLVAPDDARVVGEYGKVLVQQGRAKEAIDFLTRAIQLQENDWTLFSAIGVAYDQLGDYSSASNAYQRALRLKPNEPAVLNNYAMSRAQAGDIAMAKKLIAQAATVSAHDERVARNVKLVDGLTPLAVANAAPPPAAAPVKAVAPAPVVTKALAPPRPLSASEGRRIVTQAAPKDAKPKKKAVAAKQRDTSGIPELRLANDRP